MNAAQTAIPGVVTVAGTRGMQSSVLAGSIERTVNLVGVTEGFRKELDIVGVGYRAAANGKDKLDMSLGFSHPVVVQAPAGVEFVVPQPPRIEVHGIDKQLVGQMAADIRKVRKPEPYKGKGIRYQGEVIKLKAGKRAAANIRAIRKPEPYKGKGVRYVDERVRRKAGKAGK